MLCANFCHRVSDEPQIIYYYCFCLNASFENYDQITLGQTLCQWIHTENAWKISLSVCVAIRAPSPLHSVPMIRSNIIANFSPRPTRFFNLEFQWKNFKKTVANQTNRSNYLFIAILAQSFNIYWGCQVHLVEFNFRLAKCIQFQVSQT